MSTVVLVIIVVGALALAATVALSVVSLIRRRGRRVEARLSADLSSESALRGPERVVYRTGSGPYPRSGGNGKLVLTSTRLIFRIMIGTDVVVPLDEITGIREEKTFGHRTVVGGQRFLVVRTADGELGIAVHDIAGWLAAIEQAAPHALSAG